MRSILEKAIVHLLNEEHDKAEELFHKFMVERARQIHESLRQGDDVVLEENWDQEITSESYFTEDDLSDVEDGEGDEAGADEGDDAFGGEGEDEFGGEGDDAAAGLEDDMAVDGDAGVEDEGSVEDRIESLEAELERLTSEFEALMGSEEGDVEGDVDGDEFGAEDTAGDEFGGDEFGGDDAGADLDGGEFGDDEGEVEEGTLEIVHHDDEIAEGFDDELEEEFDDITESIVNELEKVKVTMSNSEIAKGKAVSQNNTSPIPQKKVNDRKGAKPVEIKSSEYNGYEREQAPATKTQKARQNTKKGVMDGTSKVSKEGDKSAELNKLKSDGNQKSLIGGKGSVGNNGGVSF